MSLMVSYRMKLGDWAAFQFYHLSRNPLIWLTWAALVLLFAKLPYAENVEDFEALLL
jgi:hypothetical protein